MFRPNDPIADGCAKVLGMAVVTVVGGSLIWVIGQIIQWIRS